MNKSAWYIFAAVVVVIGLGFLYWNTAWDDTNIKTSISVAEAMAGDDMEGYLRVTEPRNFTFPKDHGPHRGYKTEWWYYTGNLFTGNGRQFGYQFTIFRNQLNPLTDDQDSTGSETNWNTNQLYLGHFAISDVENEDHVFEERFSRGAAGLAGAQAKPYRIWLEDWEVKNSGAKDVGKQHFPVRLKAEMANGAAIDFDIRASKPLTLQGEEGFDRKGSEKGNASYYHSFTRMDTKGKVKVNGNQFDVSGSSWMDHEWSTSALDDSQEGWDWFSIQLSNGYDLMYYQLRNLDDTVSKFTTGALVSPDGKKTTIGPDDVKIKVLDRWKSPHSKSLYPSQWQMRIPEHDLNLDLQTLFDDQEMDVSVRYYEGTISVSGSMNGEEIGGNGFIEMTGYEED